MDWKSKDEQPPQYVQWYVHTNYPHKFRKKLDPVPAKYCDLIEFGYWNHKTQLIIDEHFIIIYGDPVIRYDNNGNHYVLVRDPNAMKPLSLNNSPRTHASHSEYSLSNSSSSHNDMNPPSLGDFMSKKEALLNDEFDEITARIHKMDIEKQALNEQLLKYEQKKKYLDEQNGLLSDIYDAEQSNKDRTSPTSQQQHAQQKGQKRKQKRVRLNVDLSTSEQFKARQYLANQVASNQQSKMEAKVRTKVLVRNRLQEIENQRVNAMQSAMQRRHEQIDLNAVVGVLKLNLIKLECRPNVDVMSVACSIRVMVEREGYQRTYTSSGYRREYHAFCFDQDDEFQIVKILNNALVIEILFGDCVQDRIKLSMLDLTRTRSERFHKIRINLKQDSYYHNSLHLSCEWKLCQSSKANSSSKKCRFEIE